MRANGRCKSCQAQIRWAKTVTGKSMPIDPLAADNGNIWVVQFSDGNPIVEVAATPDAVPAAEALRYTSHFATCPNAADHRKPR